MLGVGIGVVPVVVPVVMAVVMTMTVAVRLARADTLDMVVVAFLGQADLGLEAEDLVAVLALSRPTP